jgi:hypothetical protein
MASVSGQDRVQQSLDMCLRCPSLAYRRVPRSCSLAVQGMVADLPPVGPTAIAGFLRLSNRHASWHGFAESDQLARAGPNLGYNSAVKSLLGSPSALDTPWMVSASQGPSSACRRNGDLHKPDPVWPSRLSLQPGRHSRCNRDLPP